MTRTGTVERIGAPLQICSLKMQNRLAFNLPVSVGATSWQHRGCGRFYSPAKPVSCELGTGGAVLVERAWLHPGLLSFGELVGQDFLPRPIRLFFPFSAQPAPDVVDQDGPVGQDRHYESKNFILHKASASFRKRRPHRTLSAWLRYNKHMYVYCNDLRIERCGQTEINCCDADALWYERLFAVLFGIERRLEISGHSPNDAHIIGFVADCFLEARTEGGGLPYAGMSAVNLASQCWAKKGTSSIKRKAITR